MGLWSKCDTKKKKKTAKSWTELKKPAKGVEALAYYWKVKVITALSLAEQGKEIVLPEPGEKRKGTHRAVSKAGAEVPRPLYSRPRIPTRGFEQKLDGKVARTGVRGKKK